MSEQDSHEEIPAVAGPEGTPGAADGQPPYGDPNDPYEKRYNDLRAWTDRVSNEAAELRQEREQWQQHQGLYDLMLNADDEDTRRQAAEALGYEFEEEQQAEPDDPFQTLNERLERIEQAQTQRQDAESEREYAQAVRGVIDERLEELMPDAGEAAQNMVFAYALNALPVGDDGLPDLPGALAAFQQLLGAEQEAWAKTKRAPALNLNGQTGTQVPNLDNDQERQAYMAARLQAGDQT